MMRILSPVSKDGRARDRSAPCVNGFAFQSRLGGFHDRAHLFDGIRAGIEIAW